MITVKATREGLIGGHTSSGYIVDPHVPFVALPSTAALRLWVRVRNPLNGRQCRALVLDVGPWNTADHAYVFQPSTMWTNHADGRFDDEGRWISLGIRPQVERHPFDMSGRPHNGAAIDLGEAVWLGLGMTDNGPVSWAFV